MKKIKILCVLTMLLASGCGSNEVKETGEVDSANKYYKKDNCYDYHYQKLSKVEKQVYEQVYMNFDKGVTNFTTQGIDETKAQQIMLNVIDDHPEFYYLGFLSAVKRKDNMNFIVTYKKSKEERAIIDEQLTARLSEVKSQIHEEMQDFDKARVVYDFIVNRVSYVEESEDNQYILSSLVNDESVCAGYARAYQYLLNKLGVPTTYLTGEAYEALAGADTAHAWNMLLIDGDYYYVDTTWADANQEVPHPCYGYFMMSQEEMLKLYKPDIESEKTIQYNNYFTRNNYYLEQYDENIILMQIIDAYNKGASHVDLKIAPDQYTYTKQQLLDENRFFELLEEIGKYPETLRYFEYPEISLLEITF